MEAPKNEWDRSQSPPFNSPVRSGSGSGNGDEESEHFSGSSSGGGSGHNYSGSGSGSYSGSGSCSGSGSHSTSASRSSIEHCDESSNASHDSRSSSEAPVRKRPHVDASSDSASPSVPSASIFPVPPPSYFRSTMATPYDAIVSAPLPVLSAAPKQMHELDEGCCVRLGVFRPRAALSKEQATDEVDSVKLTGMLEHVFLESVNMASTARSGAAAVTAAAGTTTGSADAEQDFEWCRVYFSSGEQAELCAALLSAPGRRSKWRRYVTQRMPLPTHPLSPAEVGLGRVLATAVYDTVAVRSAGGFSALSTTDVFDTAAMREFIEQKRSGVITSRDVCPAFYPEAAHNKCIRAEHCAYVHVRPHAVSKLLLPSLPLPASSLATLPPSSTPATSPPSSGESNVSGAAIPSYAAPMCPWVADRQKDTLFVSSLDKEVTAKALYYMFCKCPGFSYSRTVLMSRSSGSSKRHGVVVFDTHEHAETAKTQATSASDLKISFYSLSAAGSMAEDRSVRQRFSSGGTPNLEPTTTTTLSQSTADTPGAAAAAATMDAVTFPPLPEGWEYGLSRRTMQYYFMQTGKKSTTWKHPVTQERYSAKR